MNGFPSPAAALVREVADDRMTSADIAFGFGFITIIGGGTLAMIGAVALRFAGAL